MRHKVFVVALGTLFLLITGFIPGALPFVPHARFSDAVVTHWPSALHLRDSMLQQQTFPVWRETIMAGQAFAANPLNKTAYPLQWLVLLFPPTLHLDLMIMCHLLLAGCGMWRWASLLGLRHEAAAFSALAYALTPKLVAHLGAGHLDILYALAWWPWLMGSIRRGFIRPERPLASVLRTSLFAALLLLADVRLSLFALSIAAAYEIARLLQSRQWKQIYWRVFVVAPFFLLTASVLAPLLAWQPYLSRGELTVAGAGVFSLDWGPFVGLMLPAHSGNFETLAYLGLPVLVLASVALVTKPRQHAFWIVLIVFAALYALGTNGPLWPVLVRIAPGLLWFRVPSRAWFAVVLFGALMAGYGLQYLIELIERIRANAPIAGLKIMRLAAMAGLWTALIGSGVARFFLPIPASVALSPLLWGGLLATILLAALYARLKPQFFATALIGLTFADLGWTGRNWLEWRSEEVWLMPHRGLAERLINEDPERIYSPTYSLEQQVAAAYHLRLFGGVDPFQLRAVVRAIEQASGVASCEYSVILPPLTGIASDDEIARANRGAAPNAEVLAAWDVSHVVSAYPLEDERLQLVDTVDGVYVYANQDFAPGLASGSIPSWPAGWPGLPDSHTVEQLNRLTTTAAGLSGATLIVCASALLYLELKVKRR
jgi:hypothetical protein